LVSKYSIWLLPCGVRDATYNNEPSGEYKVVVKWSIKVLVVYFLILFGVLRLYYWIAVKDVNEIIG
jgi:hypothetical protein